MNNTLTNEQQRLINIYIQQYNLTNSHIEHLLDILDEIRSNIFNILSANQPRRMRTIRPTRTSRQNNIYYDYTRPINPNIYNQNMNRNVGGNNNNNRNVSRQQPSVNLSNELSNFFLSFLDSSVPIRPTQLQIENASRLVRYSTIENPLSENCPISLERFTNDQMVRQLNPCGHLFCQASFQQWFENNVRCPVCRYDIRNYHSTEQNMDENRPSNDNIPSNENRQTNNVNVEDVNENSSQEQEQINNVSINRDPETSQIDNITFDITTNTEIGSNVINRLFQSLLSPQLTNNDSFMSDPSYNLLYYETLFSPYSRNQNNR
jgi:hypothetical protein